MIYTRHIVVVMTCTAILLSGCAATGPDPRPVSNAPVSSAVERQYSSALAVMKNKDYQAALEKLKILAARNPQLAGPRANMGIIYSSKGKFEEAKKEFEKAIEINPANPAIYNELGVLYRRMGKFQDSESAYKKALSINPNFAYAHLNLGILYDLYLRKPDKALDYYQRYQDLVKNDELVKKWIVELKLRIKRHDKVAQK